MPAGAGFNSIFIMPLATDTVLAEKSARLPGHEWFINCQRLLLKELKSSRNTRLKLPALLDEDFTDERLDEITLLDDERRDDERRDDESRDEDDELRTADDGVDDAIELVAVPFALNAAMVGVPEPFAQKPKLTELLAAIVLFHASGVTTRPARLPFHRLLICAPAVFRVIDQLVTGVLPALISTCAQ